MAFLIRVAALLRFSNSPYFLPSGDDMKFYHDWAVRILHGQWTDGHAFYGLPGYPFCLAAIYGLAGVSPLVVGIWQCALEAATVVVIGLLGSQFAKNTEEKVPGAAIGLLAGIGWIAFQPAQVYSIILMPTSWVVLAFWGVVLWVANLDAKPTWRTWLGLGSAIGIVSLLVATILMLLPLVLAAVWIHTAPGIPWSKRLGSAISAAALVLCGVFVGLAPAWAHNYLVAREPVLISAHSGLNFWLGNNPEATGYPNHIPGALSATQEGLLRDSISVARRETGRELSYAEVSAFWSARAKAWIAGHRGAWLALLARKFAYFWNAFQYDDLSMITALRNCGVISFGLRFGLVATLAIPSLLLGVWQRPGARWLAAAITLHVAALLPVFVTERYRLCAVPGLLLFASFGFWQWWQWLRDRRWFEALGYATIVGCSALFVYWPQSDKSLLALDHFNAGVRAQQIGDLSTADRELGLAVSFAPDNPSVIFAQANVSQARNDLPKAKALYAKTIAVDPGDAGAWTCLGGIAILEGNWTEASRCLETKVKLDPADARAYYLLARVRLELKDRPGARAWISEALLRAPGNPDFEATRKEIDQAE